MPIRSSILTAALLAATATLLAGGCASREYVTPNGLLEIQEDDPEFRKLRVYPNRKFIDVYTRELARGTGVSGTAGTVEAGVRGRRLEVAVKRDLPGVIVAVDQLEGTPLLWVSFDGNCFDIECSWGFIQTGDGLFRLHEVPQPEGYSAPRVYRKRTADRRLMERTVLYSGAASTPVYYTLRGFSASIALEIKKRTDVDIETKKQNPGGYKPGR